MISKNIIEKYKESKEKKLLISGYIDEKDKKQLQKLAKEHKISFNEVLRITIKEFLKGGKSGK